ncbi:MAG: hypothetical protein GY943_22410, partial [Chloroflexi bacterium]|nr:hypothetical protein [Chloroflexota bacterium]
AGSTYQARPNERVWQAMGDMLFKVYEEEHDFKNVWAGCQVRYVQIDDDDDDRRNRWLLNGHEFHVMREGMVVYGSFSITTNGHLTLYAADSIGANIDVACPDPTKTPTATVTHVPPETPIPTETSTPLPPGVTSVPTEIPTTAVTATITPTPTATEPTGPAYTRFNFEVAGHVGRDGFCYMHRDTSEQLLVWQMQDGWVDSAAHPNADSDGWIEVYIPHTSIYVEVFCDAGEGMIRMDIYNGIVHPGNGRIVGWLTRGVKNAIEIGWPDI